LLLLEAAAMADYKVAAMDPVAAVAAVAHLLIKIIGV
jgi:hypothetical protein